MSSAELRLEGSRLEAHLTFARRDLETLLRIDLDLDGKVSAAEAAMARPALERLAHDALFVLQGSRRLEPIETGVRLDESDAVHVLAVFDVRLGVAFTVGSPLVPRLARGHRQYLALRDGSGTLLAERVLDAGSAAVPVTARPAGAGTAAATMRRFVALGVEHILTGWDHLAFLLALLVAGSGLRSAAAIVTSFTVAHSITLALAALDVVRVPPVVVEPLIAASIVYVGLENVLRREPRHRWLVTFGFGLVHGFGFAGVLRELGLSSGAAAAVPLVSFNLGVEIGQLAVAALVLPLVWRLRREPVFATRFVPACSLAVSVLGAWWLFQRVVFA